jgi:hypothetical protein
MAEGPAHVVLHEEGVTEERTVSARAIRSETRRFRVAVRRARDEIAAGLVQIAHEILHG